MTLALLEGWAHRLEPDPIRQVEDDLEALLTSAAKARAWNGQTPGLQIVHRPFDYKIPKNKGPRNND